MTTSATFTQTKKCSFITTLCGLLLSSVDCNLPMLIKESCRSSSLTGILWRTGHQCYGESSLHSLLSFSRWLLFFSEFILHLESLNGMVSGQQLLVFGSTSSQERQLISIFITTASECLSLPSLATKMCSSPSFAASSMASWWKAEADGDMIQSSLTHQPTNLLKIQTSRSSMNSPSLESKFKTSNLMVSWFNTRKESKI